jgi:broad specificity phosphatase PhoE
MGSKNNLMQIALLRHGKPNFPNSGWVDGSEYKKWLEAFNANGLSDQSIPSAKLIEKTKNYKSIVCSDLNRSTESANLLGLSGKRITDKLFREAELPYWNNLGVKLPPALWTAFLRTFWLLGYSPNCESLAKTKTRAAQGAQRLIELAAKNSSVLFIGHGFINQYISKELLSNGWRGPRKHKHEYWSLNEYKK